MTASQVHVSVGAGFENDRRDLGAVAAQLLALFDGPRYLIFECLAERTLATMVQANDTAARIAHACSFLEPCIDICIEHNIRIVSNFGGPDPVAVARGIVEYLEQRGCKRSVMAVTGDALPLPEDTSAIARNAYIGAAGIVEALSAGADIIVTGRVADPSLVVGPVVHELQLDWHNWNALANATLAGHLIECGTQVCGGYFADESFEVPDMAGIGPPVATVQRNRISLSKPLGGGVLNRATITQQMLYEIHNPAAYLTPDVVLDLTEVTIASGKAIQQLGGVFDISCAKGHPRPETLKALLFCRTGWFAEGEISYAGTIASVRAGLAQTTLQQRTKNVQAEVLISCHNGVMDNLPMARVRVAARATEHAAVQQILNELDALYVNGPAASLHYSQGDQVNLRICLHT